MKKELRREVLALPPIPDNAARAYKTGLGQMVEQVNRHMSARPDIHVLTGGNPPSTMFDNHKNHALFMSSVFSLNRFELLAHTVPWVYHAYHRHGFSYSYFPVHLRAWLDVLREFLQPGDAKPLLNVYEWMVSRHQAFIEASKEPLYPPQKPEAQWKSVYEAFLRSLIDGDRAAGLEIARNSVSSLSQLNDFYIGVIQPAMYEIGSMWENGDISIAREHLASALINRIMAMQYLEIMAPGEKTGKTAVVTSATNEFHEIGATMVANSLEADGWKVDYLGANTPVMELLDFVANTNPDLLAVSSSMPFNLESIRDIIREIRTWPTEKQPFILAGGMSFTSLPDLARQLGADGYARDCREAAALARQWAENQSV